MLIDKGAAIPEGFVKGVVRAKPKPRTTRSKWITDGTVSGTKMIPADHPIPEGFSKGRTLPKKDQKG